MRAREAARGNRRQRFGAGTQVLSFQFPLGSTAATKVTWEAAYVTGKFRRRVRGRDRGPLAGRGLRQTIGEIHCAGEPDSGAIRAWKIP
ncbi:hypothetical protein D9M72_555260 [compost metagenome]